MAFGMILTSLVWLYAPALPVVAPASDTRADDTPVVAKVAPENCLLYVQWSGLSQMGDETSPIHGMLSDAEIKQFLDQVTAVFQTSVMEGARREGPQAEFLAKQALESLPLLVHQPTCLFVEQFELGPSGPQIKGGWVVDLAGKRDEFQKQFDALVAKYLEGIAKPVTIDGTEMLRVELGLGAPTVTFGIHQELLIVAIGTDAAGEILQRTTTEQPAWLAQLKSRLKVDHQCSIGYVNLQSILKQLGPMASEGPTGALLSASGLDNVEMLATVAGTDERGYVSRSLVTFNGPVRGLLHVLSEKPLTAEDLQVIPIDATLAVAAKIDLKKLIAQLLESVSVFQPDAGSQLNREWDESVDIVGFHIKHDLLDALGETWCAYHSMEEGGWLSGFTAVVTIKDRERLAKVERAVLKTMEDRPEEEPGFFMMQPIFGKVEFADQTVYYYQPSLGFIASPFTVSWCLTEDRLILSTSPQSIKAMLSRTDHFRSLAEHETVAKWLKDSPAPSSLVMADMPEIVRVGSPGLHILGRQLELMLADEGIAFDSSKIPSGQTLQKYLAEDFAIVRRVDNGIEVTSRQSVPGTSAVVMTGLIGILAETFRFDRKLQAVMMPRTAQVTRSKNNMRQIAIAALNYHDTFDKLPPAVSTDDDGNPLLSWRVHLLPYLEAGPLYEQFRLNEPWDSEHNIKLVEQMPDVFRSPGSKAEPGKTNYLTIRSDDSMYPGKRQIRLAEITDGLFQTIMIVEANDEAATIWTKPDDLTLDPMNPKRRLFGLRRDGCIVALGDSSVHILPESLDADQIKSYFTRNGGEVSEGLHR